MNFRRPQRMYALAWLLGCASLPALAQDDPAKTDSPAALFEQLDRDNDGKLTKDEVGEDRLRFFNRLVRVGDKNEDGVLTKDEFLAANKPEERPQGPPPGNPGDRRPQFGGGFSEEMFNRMDQNSDGKLAKSEVPEFLKQRLQPLFERLGKEELTREELQRPSANAFNADRGRMSDEFFKRADANGDGKLTVSEAPEQFKPILQGLLRRAGKGKEGAITLEEFKQAGPSDPMPAGGFGGFSMPRVLDADRDGKLSKEELLKAVEDFDKLDRNGDGSLDPRELSGVTGFGDRPSPETRTDRNRPNTDRPREGSDRRRPTRPGSEN